jgi:hypothetical protein
VHWLHEELYEYLIDVQVFEDNILDKYRYPEQFLIQNKDNVYWEDKYSFVEEYLLIYK